MTSSQPAFFDLLEQMLSGDPMTRVHAFVDAMSAGYGGMTVIDEACLHEGRPLMMTMQRLEHHLKRLDSPRNIRLFGRRHTTANTHFGSLEDVDGWGPALGVGGG